MHPSIHLKSSIYSAHLVWNGALVYENSVLLGRVLSIGGFCCTNFSLVQYDCEIGYVDTNVWTTRQGARPDRHDTSRLDYLSGWVTGQLYSIISCNLCLCRVLQHFTITPWMEDCSAVDQVWNGLSSVWFRPCGKWFQVDWRKEYDLISFKV